MLRTLRWRDTKTETRQGQSGIPIEEGRGLGEKEEIKLVENIKGGEKLEKMVGMGNKSEMHRKRDTYKYLGEGHSLKTEAFQSLRLSVKVARIGVTDLHCVSVS